MEVPPDASEDPNPRNRKSSAFNSYVQCLQKLEVQNKERREKAERDTIERTMENDSPDAEKCIVVEAPSEYFESPVTTPGLDEEDGISVILYQKRKSVSVNYNLEDPTEYETTRGSPGTIKPPAKRKRIQQIHGAIIGVWRDSEEADDADKHVIYSFIDNHDRLRTRIHSMNRRGEELIGNVPTSVGGFWVTFERVIFDAHLKELTPAQIKEYVKIRPDMKPGLVGDEEAVRQAKALVALNEGSSPSFKPLTHRHSLPHQSLNKTSGFQAESQALSERLRKEKVEARELQNQKTRKEVALAEAGYQVAQNAQMELKHNLKKLNKVWVAQEQVASSMSACSPAVPADHDVKYHNGIKYERSQNGFFQGKHVAQPQIVEIDGEHFIKYQILLKPHF